MHLQDIPKTKNCGTLHNDSNNKFSGLIHRRLFCCDMKVKTKDLANLVKAPVF